MKTERLDLQTPNGATTAHVALPDDESRAVVIVIQEWWGINDHIRDICARYAGEGYTAVAPDLYRGKVTTDPEEASRLMHALPTEDGMATISAAMQEVRSKYNAERVGITGYCMGGSFALRAACELHELAAAAPFYGDIPEDKILAQLTVPTLFFAGARDNWITPEKVNELKEAAHRHNLPVEAVTYDADHAFFNDTRPDVYNPEAAADAWRRVLNFFDGLLRK
jgi:carboxymethylenebutenolidase